MTVTLPRMLLVEPQFVLRRTLVAVGRDLGVAAFDEAASLERARTLLLAQAYEGVVLDFQDSARTLALLRDLRDGCFASAPDTLVVLLVATIEGVDEKVPRQLGVTAMLARPFKISQLLDRLGGVGTPQAASADAADAPLAA